MTTEDYDNSTLSDYEDEDKFGNIAAMIIFFGFCISTPFLVITCIVYTILPELGNIHGLTLRGYVGSLLGQCTFLITLFITLTQGVKPPCLLTEYAVHFSNSAIYFWLNVMCFDIWWTFGGFGPLKLSKTQPEFKKFIIYSIYVWSCTIFVTTTWAIATSLSIEDHEGFYWCFSTKSYLYVIGPIGLTLVSNIILCILTIAKIVCHNKNTGKHLDAKDSRRVQNNKQWFSLYLKLFFVMGIDFTLEIGIWITQDSKYIRLIKYIFISYRGIIVFIMFICKKKILGLLIKRCCCRRSNSHGSNSCRSTHLSTTQNTFTNSVPPHGVTDSSPERF